MLNVPSGLLARGSGAVAFPYPSLTPEVISTIARAIRWSWTRLCEQVDPKELAEVGEVRLTLALQDILNQALNQNVSPVPGFSAKYFETVERGAEVANVYGTALEKRPDLRFRLSGAQPVTERIHYGLFVECKVVGSPSSLRRYCTDGLARFVKGDYAWAMTHASMIAYVRDAGTRLVDLRTYLLNNPNQTAFVDGELTKSGTGSEDFRSSHSRDWNYSDGSVPGMIDIDHWWLTVPEP